jgi:hypothetical protein
MLADNVKHKYTTSDTNVVEVWLLMCGEKEVPMNDKFRDYQLRKELVLTSVFPTERPVGIQDDVTAVLPPSPPELHSMLKGVVGGGWDFVWEQPAEDIRQYWINGLQSVVPDECGMLGGVHM